MPGARNGAAGEADSSEVSRRGGAGGTELAGLAGLEEAERKREGARGRAGPMQWAARLGQLADELVLDASLVQPLKLVEAPHARLQAQLDLVRLHRLVDRAHLLVVGGGGGVEVGDEHDDLACRARTRVGVSYGEGWG